MDDDYFTSRPQLISIHSSIISQAMNDTRQRWADIIPIIEKGIAESEDGLFAIPETRIRESYEISDEDWNAMMMFNKEEERFIVENYLFDWRFRLHR